MKNKKGFVYWLLSEKDKRTYLGSTPYLQNRIKDHNNGKCYSTKDRRPLKLIYFEEYNTLDEARKREKYLKSRSGRRELKKIFEKFNYFYNQLEEISKMLYGLIKTHE